MQINVERVVYVVLSTAENAAVQSPLIEKKSFNGIDLVKFICSILVVAIHFSPFLVSDFENAKFINEVIQNCISRVAVPFFFVASAFFLFRKMDVCNIEWDIVKNYAFRLLQMFGVWTVLLVLGNKGHLWYLKALAVAVMLLSICLYFKMKLRYLWIIALILYAVGLLGDAYAGVGVLLRDIPGINILVRGYTVFSTTTRNGFFMGFIFVLMGCSLTQSKFRMKNSVALLGFILSMTGLFAEFYILRRYDIQKDYNMYIMLIPAVYFLFYLACNANLRDRPVYKKLRGMSTLIYFLHFIMRTVANIVIKILYTWAGINLVSYSFLITLAVTIFVAWLIEKLSEKEKFKWLKLLY